MNNVRFAKGGPNDLFKAALQVEVENRRLSIEASDAYSGDSYHTVVRLEVDNVMVLGLAGTVTPKQMCIAMEWVHTGDVDALVNIRK